MDRIKRKSAFAYVAFPLFLALLVLLLFIFRKELWGLFKDREAIRGWIEGRGVLGPLAFMAMQVIQVVIFVIPGEIVQVAGGYAFGLWLGTLYSLVGIALGSVVNFYAGRLLGRPFVESIVAPEKISKIESVTGSGKGAAGFFLLFAIPGLPIKDALTYVAGMSRMSLPLFLAVTMGGRLPGILGSAYMGSAAYSGAYRGAIIVLAVAAALFVLGLVFKDKIQEGIGRLLRRGKGPGK
jgi:uncharacterized membrane protein YdjX (TVP38/TMEM64 family)